MRLISSEVSKSGHNLAIGKCACGLPCRTCQAECNCNDGEQCARIISTERYFPNGDHYEGNGKYSANGQGTMFYANGSRYEGEWRDGEKHGQGTHFSVYAKASDPSLRRAQDQLPQPTPFRHN